MEGCAACGIAAHVRFACMISRAPTPFTYQRCCIIFLLLQGVSELKRDMSERAVLVEMPEIHQFLDGFYLSRIGIRILIGTTAEEFGSGAAGGVGTVMQHLRRAFAYLQGGLCAVEELAFVVNCV